MCKPKPRRPVKKEQSQPVYLISEFDGLGFADTTVLRAGIYPSSMARCQV